MHGTGQVSGDVINGDPLGRSATTDEGKAAKDAARTREARDVAYSAGQLLTNVRAVTAEEFYWQESHYDNDSRHGRELLFLIANHEWVRASSEIIEISRSDAIDTTIKIDIDLGQITHEAFRKRIGIFWLPITVLPTQPTESAQNESGRHRLEPDPVATVTDAAGNLLPLMPAADIRHYISAAMAEIIVNMAVARWPDSDGKRPTATRDQRLLLSAAIYRSLRRGSGAGNPGVPDTVTKEPETSASESRINNARQELVRLLGRYNGLLDQVAKKFSQEQADINAAQDTRQFAPELARRAVVVLKALADSVLVVVPIDCASAPTVLTVKVPTRSLKSPSISKLMHPSTWMLRPLGRLEIDVLLATADAHRQAEIHLPDGVSFDKPHPAEAGGTSLPRMDIGVRRPQPMRDLTVLMEQILNRPKPFPMQRCLADLAGSKMTSIRETLRQYDVAPAPGVSFFSPRARRTATSQARSTLARLHGALDQLYASGDVAATDLKDEWETFQRETFSLCRRASMEGPSPRTVIARAEMIEDVYQQATPKTARIYANVVVDDSEYFSIARFSGRMSLLLMTVVLAFLAISQVTKIGEILSPEVLAIVLTLFSAIQAGQMESPDRSTIRGLLSAAGNWLIAASILPAVILAVALAFSKGGWAPTIWAVICVCLQLLFQLAMWRGPLTPSGSPRAKQRRRFSTEKPNYDPFQALRSDYWRSTTADALTIGRTAYAYVVWQKKQEGKATPQLKPLLNWKSRIPVPEEPADVLALLRAGTFGQAMTFVVFRQEPESWIKNSTIRQVPESSIVKNATITRPDFDPDRLAPMESITSVVDIFVGILRSEFWTIANHPVVSVLNAAARRLMVLDAQLPVPAPVGGYGCRQWARVRVGLRNTGDLERLAPFLDEVYKRADSTSSSGQPYVVAVKAARTAPPQIITESEKFRTTESKPVWTSDLDITYAAANLDESPDDHTWRVLTFCSDARSNIESDIVHKVAEVTGQQLQLVGLTYALLHGMAIMTLIVHEPENYFEPDGELGTKLSQDGRKLQVLVNEKLSRNELAPPTEYPLLRVHFRWRDRPGAILNVLDSLNKALIDEFSIMNEDQWSVSYARTQAPAGGAAVARLTLRIHIPRGDLGSWSKDRDDIERKVRMRAAIGAITGHSTNSVGDESDMPEDPVISVNVIRTPPNSDIPLPRTLMEFSMGSLDDKMRRLLPEIEKRIEEKERAEKKLREDRQELADAVSKFLSIMKVHNNPGSSKDPRIGFWKRHWLVQDKEVLHKGWDDGPRWDTWHRYNYLLTDGSLCVLEGTDDGAYRGKRAGMMRAVKRKGEYGSDDAPPERLLELLAENHLVWR